MPFSERTLRRILAAYVPDASSRRASVRAALRLTRRLNSWGNGTIVKADVFGSVAKRTDIIGGADVDLFVSLTSRIPESLREIKESLFDWLYREQGYVVRRQNVSVRVHHGDKKIDVVPAKRLRETGNDHYLWLREEESRTKTNVRKQLGYVRRSMRQKEIRLAKIWRTSHDLECPSFLLELAVIRALRGRPRGHLASNFESVLNYLATSFHRARLTDPGNSANIVSSSIDADEKALIAERARASLDVSSTARAFGPIDV